MDIDTSGSLTDLVNQIDQALIDHPDVAAHNAAGVLLSRVVLLMSLDPATGKQLVKYVWERLDELEQSNPNPKF